MHSKPIASISPRLPILLRAYLQRSRASASIFSKALKALCKAYIPLQKPSPFLLSHACPAFISHTKASVLRRLYIPRKCFTLNIGDFSFLATLQHFRAKIHRKPRHAVAFCLVFTDFVLKIDRNLPESPAHFTCKRHLDCDNIYTEAE